MKRHTALMSALLMAVMASVPAQANHRDQPIRIQIPIYEHGPETLKLKKMIHRQERLNLDQYRLRAVIIHSGAHSHGYASLRVGSHRSGPVFLAGRERTRIHAPGAVGDRWRLRIGPGARVRSVTAVLEPRHSRHAHRDQARYHAHRDHHGYHAHSGHQRSHAHRHGRADRSAYHAHRSSQQGRRHHHDRITWHQGASRTHEYRARPPGSRDHREHADRGSRHQGDDDARRQRQTGEGIEEARRTYSRLRTHRG